MKIVERIPVSVEPLDDARLTRIERNIVAGAAGLADQTQNVRLRGRSSYGFAIAMCAVAAAAVIGWQLHAMTAHGGGAADPIASASTETAAPLAIATHGDRQTVEIGDASIEVGAETSFAVTRPAGGVSIALARGRIELEVGKRHGRPPLVVHARDTDVIVVGTHFSVDAGDGQGDVEVRVTEGVVRVVRQQSEVKIAAGESWRASTGRVEAIAAVAEGGSSSGNSSGGSSSSSSGNGSGPTTIAINGNVKIPVGRAPELLHGRTSAVPVAVGPVASSVHSHAAIAPRDHEVAVTAGPLLDLDRDISKAPLAHGIDNGIRDPEEAHKAYQATAAKKDDPNTASAALYADALLEANTESLGGKPAALRTLDMYLRRFEAAPERADALWARARFLCLRGITAACREAAASYTREFPNGPRADLALQITQTD